MNGINNNMGDEMNALLNQTPAKKKHKVSIKDAKDLMDPLHDLMADIFDLKDRMNDIAFLKLSNKVAEIAKGEFYIELNEIAGKKPRAEYKRIKKDNRKMVIQFPDLYCNCQRCNTPIMKKSLATHLDSQDCKDKAYLIKATKDSETPVAETNVKIVEMYDNNEPLVEVELTAENYFWVGNLFGDH